MVCEIEIEDALKLKIPIIDVRSPGEFSKGHIPNAHNIALFSDDERAHVGTVYKQLSKEDAIKVGYEYVNPKLEHFINASRQLAPNGSITVHCWRGGMRSRSFAQHLSDNGFNDVKVIIAGYKAYRNYVLDNFEKSFNLIVIGGYTGSGKTHILKQLHDKGHQVIDLEGLANHKGSAFGGIGLSQQPTVEQFENNLHSEFSKLNLNKPIWIEDESHNIGSVKIPMPLYLQMRSAKLYFIDIPKEQRAKHLVSEYANIDKNYLIQSILRISKRLGGLNVKNAIEFIESGNYYEVATIALQYYDKSYEKGLNNRVAENVVKIPLLNTNHALNAFIIEKQVK